MFGFGKGKIKIELSNYNYTEGQIIEGVLKLTVKKPQLGKELSIRLIGRQRITSSNFNNRRQTRTSRTIIIFDFKQPLDGEKQYHTGQEFSYPFKIQIPNELKNNQVPNGAMGAVMKAARFLSVGRSITRWYLIGRLSIKGLDIKKTVQINIA